MADIISSPRQVDIEADFAAPRGMLLPIGDVQPATDNLRRTAAGEDEDRKLRDSIAAVGIFTPILVRPTASGTTWEVIDGHRRLAAAQQAGLAKVPVTVRAANDAEQMAVQAAANIVRAPLSDVDQWEAIKRLQERGYSIVDAAHTLGMPERAARRVSLLAHLHQDILEQIRSHGMPPTSHLATIAKASLKTQAAALKRPTSWWHRGKNRELSWNDLAMTCMEQRIPQGRAIFDIGASKVAFEEDLFAQPGSDEQFSTRDVAGFLKAQKTALEAEADKSRGKVLVAEWNPDRRAVMLPKGWLPYAMGTKPKGLVTLKAIVPAGSEVGLIVAQQAAPKPPPEKKKPAATPVAGDTQANAEPETPAPTTGRGPITQAGLELIAQAQTEAICQRITAAAGELDEGEMLQLLLLALCSDNITVTGFSTGAYASRVTFKDVSSALLDETGEQRDLHATQARMLAADVIARCIRVTPRGGYGGSGAPAHWIGRWIDAAASMPRLDTPEILATLSLETLREAAFAAGLKPAGTAKALREQLAGHAPALTLPQAAFSASGPKTRTEIEEDGDDA